MSELFSHFLSVRALVLTEKLKLHFFKNGFDIWIILGWFPGILQRKLFRSLRSTVLEIFVKSFCNCKIIDEQFFP